MLPVGVHGVRGRLRVEVVGEGVGQAELGGEFGAAGRGAEQPQRRHVPAEDGDRLDLRVLGRVEVGPELVELPAEGLRGPLPFGTDRVHGRPRTARGAAEAEVDPSRVERGQRAELLGHHDRSVVGQQDPARADAQVPGGVGEVADEDGGGGARSVRCPAPKCVRQPAGTRSCSSSPVTPQPFHSSAAPDLRRAECPG